MRVRVKLRYSCIILSIIPKLRYNYKLDRQNHLLLKVFVFLFPFALDSGLVKIVKKAPLP